MKVNTSSLKICAYAFNWMFLFFSVLLLILGIWLLAALAGLQDIIAFGEDLLPAMYITIGTMSVMLAIYGCVGLERSSRCLMLMEAIMIFIVLIFKLTLLVLLLVHWSGVNRNITGRLDTAYGKYNNDSIIKQNINKMQTRFNCCGFNHSKFWEGPVPSSCCQNKPDCSSTSTFKHTCVEMMEAISLISHSMGTGLLCLMLFVDIFGIAILCTLSKQFEADYNEIK